MIIKPTKLANVSASLREGSRLLARILLFGSLITGQLVLTSSHAQAGIAYAPIIEGNCGFYRPFIRGITKWSGFSSSTRGNANAILYRYWSSSVGYIEVANAFDEVIGATETVDVEANLLNVDGWYEGKTYHFLTAYVGGVTKSKITGEFYCYPRYQ